MALSNPKKNEPAQPKKAPAEKIRVGMTTVSIWENTDDKGNLHQNVTFELRYKDAQGNFKTGHSYGLYDLLSHRAAVDRAIDRLIAVRNGADE